MSTDEYVPSADGVRARYVLGGMPDNAMHDQIARAVKREGPEFDRFLTRVRRDAARSALDGLIADAEADIRIGAIGGDEDRIMRARAVIAAAVDYRDDEYPEEQP